MIIYYKILVFTSIISAFGCFIKNYGRKKAAYPNAKINADNNKLERSIPLFFAAASFSLLVYYIAARSFYGDTWLYIVSFNDSSSNLSSIKAILESDIDEKGYKILVILFKHYISKNYNDWFTFLAIFQAGAIVLTYYKYSCNFFMSAFLFIASTTFTWMMNGIRQFTAVCLILYFFDYIINKKTIKFFIIVFLAYSLHQSAIFWIPVFFIVHFKPWSKKIWICVLLTLLVVFGIDQFTDWLDTASEGTEYAGMGSQLVNYSGDGQAVDDGVNPISVIITAVPPAIALWRRKYVEAKATPFINICLNLSVVAVGVNLVGMVTSGILVGRIPIYFTLTNFILLPWLLNNVFEGKVKHLLKFLCYALYFVYFYYCMVILGGGQYASSKLGLYYK